MLVWNGVVFFKIVGVQLTVGYLKIMINFIPLRKEFFYYEKVSLKRNTMEKHWVS